MFRYLTSYRFYSLAKIGFGLAYLWFVWDYFQIHVAYWNGLNLLLPAPTETSAAPSSFLHQLDHLLAGKFFIYLFAAAAPFIVALYLWGRHRWLQLAVGCWLYFSMVAMVSLVGIFASTADVWLSYVFFSYILAALTCPSAEWAVREPGLSRSRWRDDPVLASTYAWLVVLVQFNVYFFAGVNKLIDGWGPWTSGTALQNLAVDSSMHDFDRGIYVPYGASLILCYITLFQRLAVPFGFYFMRYRGWAVLILGAMHVGYDILMQVAVFPLIGVSALLMIVPPRSLALPLFSRPSLHQPRPVRRLLHDLPAQRLFPLVMLWLLSLWLVGESARLTVSDSSFWENRLVLVPSWRMFADGGINAGKSWRIVFETPQGEVDATSYPLQLLPSIWRDRFYKDQILHYLLNGDAAAPLPSDLLQTAELRYRQQQLQLHQDPAVLKSGFIILPPPHPGPAAEGG